MDSMDSTRLCRLCLKSSGDVVNVFESFQHSTIASILTQHFWFKVDKNDGSSEYVCEICWINVKTFHNFYKRVEWLHKKCSVSLSKTKANSCSYLIKKAPSHNLSLEPDLTIINNDAAEASAQPIDFEIIKVESLHDYNSNNGQPLDDDDQTTYKKQKDDDDDQITNKKQKDDGFGDSLACDSGSEEEVDVDESHQSSRTRSEKEKVDAQIREFFNMKCEICNDVELKTLVEVKRHYRKMHKQSGYITCCGKRFDRRFMILNHIVNHLHPDAFRCDQCDKLFKNRRALKNHIANHAPQSSRAFKCSLCSISFVKAMSLKAHVQYAHIAKEKGPFTCDICNKTFPSKSLMSHHIQYVHVRVPTHICEICGKAFKFIQTLRSHVEQHSTTPRPKVQCNICGAWLKNTKGLQYHVKRLHDAQAKVVNCSICSKVVPNRKALSNHTKYVHGKSDHQCTLCDKAFKTRTALKEHMAGHTGEDLYSCSYCEKTFKSNANFHTHRKKMHFEEWTRDRKQHNRT